MFFPYKIYYFPDYYSKKFISIHKNPYIHTGAWTCNFYVHHHAEWNLSRASRDVTLGTGLKHSRDFWLSLEGC